MAEKTKPAETKTAPYTLASIKPNPHSRPKRTRVGRGHGSGMVKTGGEGGKGEKKDCSTTKRVH